MGWGFDPQPVWKGGYGRVPPSYEVEFKVLLYLGI